MSCCVDRTAHTKNNRMKTLVDLIASDSDGPFPAVRVRSVPQTGTCLLGEFWESRQTANSKLDHCRFRCDLKHRQSFYK